MQRMTWGWATAGKVFYLTIVFMQDVGLHLLSEKLFPTDLAKGLITAPTLGLDRRKSRSHYTSM
jgi:hypothetical protein